MPHKTNTFAHSSILMLLIGAAILVGIVLSSLFQARMTQSYFTTVVELRNARAASADMLVLLQAAETGQRGFLLTQNENFLEPYQRSMDELGIRMERLKATLDAEDSVVESVSRIEYLITEKLTELRETVAMAQAGDVAGAVAVVRAEYGRQVMEEAQDLLRSLIAALDLRLNEGVEELSSSAVSMQWFAIGGGIVIIAVVGGAILIVM